MNATRKLGSLAVASLLLAACATAPVATIKGAEEQRAVDQDYVSAVEEATRTASVRVRVYWVNPPLDTDQAD